MATPAERPGAQSYRSKGHKPYDSGIAGMRFLKRDGLVYSGPPDNYPIVGRCHRLIFSTARFAPIFQGGIRQCKTEAQVLI